MLARCLIVAWTAAAAVCLVSGHSESMENQRGFLFDPTHTQFAMPIDVSVGLCGLQGDGAAAVQLDSQQIQRALTEALPIHSPANVQLEESAHVQMHLRYDATHLPRSVLLQAEKLLQKHMRFIGQTIEGISVYDIAAEQLEPSLSLFYHSHFVAPLGTAGATRPPLVLMVFNPDKVRMNPTPGGTGPYIYRYRYAQGAPTQQWVAKQRFVFIDLAAGPCSYGPSDSGEGTVSLGSVPLVDVKPAGADGRVEQNVATVKFVSELSSFLLSAVRHVVVSDLQYRHIKYAEKLIVPVVVFRNHRRFHPLRQEGGIDTLEENAAGPVNDLKIDLAVIKAALKSMMLPDQELMLVHGAHHLHDHHQISTAVFKALKQDAVHTANANGVDSVQSRPYLDSKILIEELERASDAVIAGLLLSEDGVAPSSPLPGVSSRPAGHHMLPVFVLSLLGMPPGLLLDQKHLHVATSRCVLVLQTASAPIALPYFSDGSLVYLNPRRPTRHIVAGLSTALGGLLPPYDRFDVEKKRVASNFLWAHGALPWGPFSNSSSLSLIFADQMVRNSVISRVSSSMRAIQRAMRLMSEFQREFVEWDELDAAQKQQQSQAASQPFGTPDSPGQSLTNRHGVVVLARDVSVRLASQLSGLESQFLQLSADITADRWSQSTRLSSTILVTSRAFAKYVETEIDSARLALSCCHKSYDVPASESSWTWLLSLLLLLTLGAGVFAFVRARLPSGPATFNRYSQLRPNVGTAAAAKPRNAMCTGAVHVQR